MPSLFHHALAVAVLGSGSRGNCTYVGDGRHGVLIDCGLSTRRITTRLEQLGLSDAPIDAVLITHEHSDHVGAARVLSKALARRRGAPAPFYMTPGTREALHPSCVPERVEPVVPGRPFRVGALTIEPIAVPHDTLDPVAYTVEAQGTRAGVITDLGRGTRLVEQQVASLDVAVLEFNHDVDMLLQGDYPWQLKQRIRGPHGHLSNDQAGEIVERGASDRLRHLVLAHLSEENNAPDKALTRASIALHRAKRRDVTVHVATQDAPLPPIELEPVFAAAAPSPRRAPAPPARGQMGLFERG